MAGGARQWGLSRFLAISYFVCQSKKECSSDALSALGAVL